MHNAIESGVFLAWFTARAAFVGIAYLMARGKGRNPFAWTVAAACGGFLAVAVLGFLEDAGSEKTFRSGTHSLQAAPARSRRSFTA